MQARTQVGPIRNPSASNKKQRGVYALMFAVLLIPLICTVGCALDLARMVQYKGDLQSAVDEAALAGAAVLNSGGTATNQFAVQVATNYFKHAMLPASISVTGPTVTANNLGSVPGGGTLPNGNPAYTVTVSASATVANSLFALFIPSFNMSVTGTAAEPLVSSNLNLGGKNQQACDQNNLYIYEVPKTADGTGYDYSTTALNLLPASAFTLVTKGAALPSAAANQPFGIKLVNSTNDGQCGTSSSPNGYGAPSGSTQSFYSSLLANGQSPNADSSNTTTPSANSNSTYPVVVTSVNTVSPFQNTTSIKKIVVTPQGGSLTTYTNTNGSQTLTLASYTGNAACTVKSATTSTATNGFTTTNTTTTTYSCTTQYVTTTNCSLYVETGVNVTADYVNGLSSTSVAPTASAGKCSSLATGIQYSAPTCSQLSALANTGSAPAAVFWWNDEGGGKDDYDYNDAYFAATCTVGGGTASGNTEVVLTQ